MMRDVLILGPISLWTRVYLPFIPAITSKNLTRHQTPKLSHDIPYNRLGWIYNVISGLITSYFVQFLFHLSSLWNITVKCPISENVFSSYPHFNWKKVINERYLSWINYFENNFRKAQKWTKIFSLRWKLIRHPTHETAMLSTRLAPSILLRRVIVWIYSYGAAGIWMYS